MDDFWNEISNVIPSSSGILSNLDLDLDLDSVLVDEISSDNTIGDKRIRPFSVEQPKEKIQKIEEFNPDSIFDFDDVEEEPLVSEEIHPIKENSTLVPISKLGNQYKVRNIILKVCLLYLVIVCNDRMYFHMNI